MVEPNRRVPKPRFCAHQIGNRSISVARNERPAYLITDHPAAKGVTNEYFWEAGAYVRSSSSNEGSFPQSRWILAGCGLLLLSADNRSSATARHPPAPCHLRTDRRAIRRANWTTSSSLSGVNAWRGVYGSDPGVQGWSPAITPWRAPSHHLQPLQRPGPVDPLLGVRSCQSHDSHIGLLKLLEL